MPVRKSAAYTGYSTYTFQDGDSLTLKFTGGWGQERNGGDYEVLSGTGVFKTLPEPGALMR